MSERKRAEEVARDVVEQFTASYTFPESGEVTYHVQGYPDDLIVAIEKALLQFSKEESEKSNEEDRTALRGANSLIAACRVANKEQAERIKKLEAENAELKKKLEIAIKSCWVEK